MLPVKKAVIPVAGLGTRMLPATKAIPKEMLPVVDKPLIQYVVNEAVSAGINEIVLVTHASKNAIENHFDTSFELEAQLDKRQKRQLLNEVRSIIPPGVTVISVRQAEAKGLGHAILCARPVIGENPFAVLLPDVLIHDQPADSAGNNLTEMLYNYQSSGRAQVMVDPVPWKDVAHYGIVDCLDSQLAERGTTRVSGVIEKPSIDAAPSNMAIVGRYIFPADIWPLLASTQPDNSGEIQLTDAMLPLVKESRLDAFRLAGKSFDCGSKIGYMKAQLHYIHGHPEFLRDRDKTPAKVQMPITE
ncbi:UTP--glucose-1-phosphate uridylyltransferase GalU [Biformimicrobium ophioploci]|uniref:UTP--glucose-1-phosphate uridylyltransferase n=1 Tax=Biformimicrobium ophioploci TaxID=3036711 RepID=A0ABQ6M0B4_9GAMM|nr:UTP--glucose-1-phosphate uridylyltransferase GalU [Microbulbifer sp. NKW57]GMG87754.1 UTP--glucose-1-phosphate uridylyltransferase GalU [Microbulbifer sp. NKW57]